MTNTTASPLLSLCTGEALAERMTAVECAQDTSETLWDNELARRVHGDPDQFITLYERYYERILNYLYRRTFNLEEAQDLTARTFLQAFEALRRREQRLLFRPWLYRIATNVHTSHVRRLCRWAARVTDVGRRELQRVVGTPRDLATSGENAEAVRSALNSLPEKYRVPLILRFDEELSHAEIAAILQLTETGTRSRVARALQLLGHKLGEGRR